MNEDSLSPDDPWFSGFDEVSLKLPAPAGCDHLDELTKLREIKAAAEYFLDAYNGGHSWVIENAWSVLTCALGKCGPDGCADCREDPVVDPDPVYVDPALFEWLKTTSARSTTPEDEEALAAMYEDNER